MVWTYYSDLDAFSLYHKAQEEVASNSSESFLPALGNALAGAAGTAVSNVIVYPLDLVITRLQVQQKVGKTKGKSTSDDNDSNYTGVIDASKKIYENEGGLSAFYSGVLQDTGKSVADAFLFFLAYNVLYRARKRSKSSGALSVVDELAVGMAAGAFARGLTMPIQQVVTRKQTAAMASSAKSDDEKPKELGRDLSSIEIMKQIYKNEGLQGFWTGFSATVILTLNPSITFFLDSFFRRLLKLGDKPGSGMTFLLAATGKSCASTIMYPFTVVKARAQGGNKKPGNVLATIPETIQRDGVTSLYAGLSGEVLKGFFSHGLTMLVKARIQRLVIGLYFLLSRIMRRGQK